MTQGALGHLDALVDAGITASINANGAAAGLPPLAWSLSEVVDVTVEGTHPEGRATPGAAELCERWARFLELEVNDASGPAEGFVTWSGLTPQGLSVELHAITDAELYRQSWPEDIL